MTFKLKVSIVISINTRTICLRFSFSLGSEACIPSVFKSELRSGEDKASALKSILVFLRIRQFRIVHNC